MESSSTKLRNYIPTYNIFDATGMHFVFSSPKEQRNEAHEPKCSSGISASAGLLLRIFADAP
jgi:hypothetical protein